MLSSPGVLLALFWNDGIPWCSYFLSPSVQFVQGSRSWQRSLWTSFSWNHTPYMTLNSDVYTYGLSIIITIHGCRKLLIIGSIRRKIWQTLDERKKSFQFFLCKWISLFVTQRLFVSIFKFASKKHTFWTKESDISSHIRLQNRTYYYKSFPSRSKIFGKHHH